MMKTKDLLLLIGILFVCITGCQDITEGYLEVDEASYTPDTLYVYKTLDPVNDAVRIREDAPWVSLAIEGVLGTAQIHYSVENVTAPELGEAAAKIVKDELTIRGGGIMQYPLKNQAQPGTYKVSVRVTNPGYSKVIQDAMTIIVKD
ncbi:hypothetical protein [Butyricimonas synergistica]|uniref:hypothetical protein n=1 Tax=Butyricimonas synergistica TaxID=544644 RepID=UPI0003737965|nr:hypothetical protein [Butyricimonas synergistica]